MSFSIVTCTHNPEPEIFRRLINSITALLLLKDSNTEWIIVDNNSSNLVQETFDFSDVRIDLHHIVEKKPGLTAARIAGITQSKYDWLIFFDDDNEPAKDYLVQAQNVIQQYPEVGAWGPGSIEVVFHGRAFNDWIVSKSELFQQRKDTRIETDDKKEWRECYPYGTGLILDRRIACLYKERVRCGQYTLTDRKGDSLASGGDIQMVWTAIEQGSSAGRAPAISLKHNISKDKSVLKYLIKQEYGTSSAYIKGYNQVFSKHKIHIGGITNLDVLRMLYVKYRIYYSTMTRADFKLLIAQKLGEMNSSIMAGNKRQPFLLRLYERTIT